MVLEATPLLFTAVGLALSELLSFVKDLQTKAAKFRSLLERLETTLKALSPVFDDIEERSKQELDQKENVLQELKQLLAKGDGLLVKCRDNPDWNYWGRRRLSKKLIKYDDEICRFCDLHLSLLTFREMINNTETLNNINRNLSNIPSSVWSVGSSCRLIGSCCDALELSEFTVGIDLPLEELKEMLLKDTKTIHVLSGGGGSGKTTLAKKLFHDRKVRGKYDKNSFFITVKGTSVKEIIQKLFQHKGYPVPDIQLDQDAKGHLESLLKKLQPDPVLLILDDVSPDSNFPINTFVFEKLDYKVLITSRFTFSVAAASTYKLKLLNDENSMVLFRHYAFPNNGVPDFIDDDLVNQVVKKCKNNPLILKVIAGSLVSEPMVVWKSLLKNWSEKLRNSKNEQIDTLRFCVDALGNGGLLKDCFYDLACFPDDLQIPAAALIDMWVELYRLEENDAMRNLLQLSKRNLVDMMTTRKDATEIHICYTDVFVTQHDNLKELAINPIEQGKRLIIEISKNHFQELPLNLKEPAADVRLLSISTDEMSKVNWCNMELHKVEALILNCRMTSYMLPEIMEKMGQLLKLLIVTNYGISPAELTNFLILGSLSNVRRIRFKNVIIPSIPEKMKHVKSLKKLSLVMCKMDQAFKSSAVQFFDIFPELEELDIDYCSDIVESPPLPCNFTSFKKLSITNCPKLTKLSKEIGQLGALEELNLHACSELTELPISIGNLKNLIFLNISDCVSLTKLPETVGELGSLKKIHMRGCTSLSELPESIINLHNLREVFGDEERVALWNAKKSSFANLQVHEVKENVNLNWLL